jgi:hypothetical protein
MDKETKCAGVGCNVRDECFRFRTLQVPFPEDVMNRGMFLKIDEDGKTSCDDFYSFDVGLYEYSRMQGLTPKQVHSRMAELAGGFKEILKKYGYGK